jgi:hypothetical protein
LPVEYSIDHEAHLVTVTAHGKVVLEEILDYFDALVVQDAMTYPKLVDAREAVPALSDDDVMILGARVSAYAAFDPRGAVAAVATTPAAAAILRRFMNLGDASRSMRLFTSVDAAVAWLQDTTLMQSRLT